MLSVACTNRVVDIGFSTLLPRIPWPFSWLQWIGIAAKQN